MMVAVMMFMVFVVEWTEILEDGPKMYYRELNSWLLEARKSSKEQQQGTAARNSSKEQQLYLTVDYQSADLVELKSKMIVGGDCKIFVYGDGSESRHALQINRTREFQSMDRTYLPEFWHSALKGHPMRTNDSNEADLFFIPPKYTLNFRLNLPRIRTKGGISNHIAVCGRVSNNCFGQDVFRAKNITKLAYDAVHCRYSPAMVRPYGGENCNPNGWLEVPYLQSFIERPGLDIESHFDFEQRNVFISGVFKGRNWHKLRRELMSLCLSYGGKFDRMGREICHWTNKTHSQEQYMKMYGTSVFSLQPTGDSPTRKAIWDSLSMGSIPVIFDPNSILKMYSDIFDWNATADPIMIRIDTSNLHFSDWDGRDVVKHLQSIPDAQIAAIRENIKRFIHRFSYYDPMFRYEKGVTRQPDAIDWTLDYLCRAIKKDEEWDDER